MASVKGVDDIRNIGDMVRTMEALGISYDGLETLNEMKAKLKDTIKQPAKKPSWAAGQAFCLLSEAKEEEVKKGRDLLVFYNRTKELLSGMTENDLELLQKHVGNIEKNFTERMDQLTHKECFLLVAGETSSGKSSLVNLILGEEILPSSHLCTTSTICELKYGNERKLVAHFKDKDTGKQTITLNEPTASASPEQSYRGQISPYVFEEGSKYKKIELFWPHDFLQNGIVIVDSPGIGESQEMDKIVIQYLPKAFAFIYVINSANADGIQEDRLGALFKKTFQASLGTLEEGESKTPRGQEQDASLHTHLRLLSQCTLFVCNKWETVPQNEIKKVKISIIQKLQSAWHGFDSESQVIFLSTKRALKAQKYGLITDEFLSLMNGMRSVVLNTTGTKLAIQWRWLDHLLKRIIIQAKVLMKNAVKDREEVKEKMEQVHLRLEAIKNDKDKVIEDLATDLDGCISKVVRQLTEYLSSDDVKSRFTSWKPDEVERTEMSSWGETKVQVTTLLSSRLQKFIRNWEEDNKVFANARESFLQHIHQRLNTVAVQLDELQRDVTGFTWGPRREEVTLIRPWPWMLSAAAFFGSALLSINFGLENRDRLFRPFSLAPSSFDKLLSYSTYASSYLINSLKYNQDKIAFMESNSETYLSVASIKKLVTNFVKDEFRGPKHWLNEIEDRLPKLIEADEKLYGELETEERSQDALREVYKPIKDEGSTLRGQLAVLGIRKVCPVDFKSEELLWKEDESSRLGSGAFGAVYQGQMRGNEEVKTVALKVYKEELAASNATAVMEEVEWLRVLDHPNIVNFYGTSLIGDEDNARVILVMEKCKGDLKSHILRNPSSVPGRSGESVVVKKTCQWVKEITDALAFIHEKGIVHRDLKLENILLSEENSVRIGDVGLSKEEKNITGTLAGTPVYLAPEVFRGEKYDCKVDIYSLGIILWEMWYGQQAFLLDAPLRQEEFFRWVEKGNRPVDMKGYRRPPPIWEDMMTSCWDRDPEKRPTAQKCNEDMEQYCVQIDKTGVI